MDGCDSSRAHTAERTVLRVGFRSFLDRLSDYHGANGPIQRHTDMATSASVAYLARSRRVRSHRRTTNSRNSATGGGSSLIPSPCRKTAKAPAQELLPSIGPASAPPEKLRCFSRTETAPEKDKDNQRQARLHVTGTDTRGRQRGGHQEAVARQVETRTNAISPRPLSRGFLTIAK
mgnify:FL=1